MSSKKGRMLYVPPVIIDEVGDLMAEHNLDRRVEAFEKLADYARLGRETERITQFKGLRWPMTRGRV